jgi:hypothetical protein
MSNGFGPMSVETPEGICRGRKKEQSIGQCSIHFARDNDDDDDDDASKDCILLHPLTIIWFCCGSKDARPAHHIYKLIRDENFNPLDSPIKFRCCKFQSLG